MVGIASGVGDMVAGVAEHEAGKFTRSVMNRNAIMRERDGTAEVTRVRDTARLQVGRQIAGLAASGFELSGSAFDAIKESLIESEMDALTLRRRASTEALAMRTQGDIAYAGGYNKMSGGIISGAAKIYDAATSNYAAAAGGG